MVPLHLLARTALRGRTSLRGAIGATALALAAGLHAQQIQVDSLSDAIAEGRLQLQVRPRFADISDTDKAERTRAWTLRTTLGWQTASWDDWRAVVEGIHTDVVGAHRLNTDPAQIISSPYPLLPDPGSTDTNRVYLENRSLPDTRLRLGKQPVRLDNERFFSDIDFRQTPLMFTGLTVENNSLSHTQVYGALLNRERTVLAAQARTRLWILRVAVSPVHDQSVAAYAYGLNQPQTGSFTGLADNSHLVFGLRAEGLMPLDARLSWMYTAEGARQRHYAGGDPLIDAAYWRLGTGLLCPAWADSGIRLDREVRSSNAGRYGFQIPFEDPYAYNGWALQFTSAPAAGLHDTWLSMRSQPGHFQLVAELHRFATDAGGVDLGNERDLRVVYAVSASLSLKLQHARFRAGEPASDSYDVTKTWLSLTYDY
jgi:hypothetical protein